MTLKNIKFIVKVQLPIVRPAINIISKIKKMFF